MKTSHLLIFTGSVAALGLSLYVTKFSDRDLLALDLNHALSSVDTRSSGQANDHGGGMAPALAALKGEIALLKAEIATVKKASIRLSPVQKELSKLKEEVAALHRQIVNFSTASESLDNAEDLQKPAGFTEQDIITATQEQAYEDRKRMEMINSVFLSENADYQWAARTTDLITQHLGKGEQVQTILSDVECRTTLCRVEVNHEDATAAGEFELQFSMQVGEVLPQTSYFYEPQDNGSISVVMYLAREGYDLPQVVQ